MGELLEGAGATFGLQVETRTESTLSELKAPIYGVFIGISGASIHKRNATPYP